MILVVAGDLSGRVVRSGLIVERLTGGVGEAVDGAFKQVVRNTIEVAAVSKPLAPRRDVVGRALALGLNENGQTHEVLAVPCGERFEKLDTLSVGAYLDFNLGKVRTDA